MLSRRTVPEKSGLVLFYLSQVGKSRFLTFATKTFLFLVELQSETFVKLLTEIFSFCIAFNRTISSLGVYGGPEKDQVFKFLGETILLGPLPSDSSCELHIFGHDGHPSGMYCTQIGILQ